MAVGTDVGTQGVVMAAGSAPTAVPTCRVIVSTVHPFADWRLAGGSYFTDEIIDDTWQTGRGAGWRVRFRRAPLTTWCGEFRAAGFLIDALVEPLPAPSMRAHFPEDDAALRQAPFFILFGLRKDAAGAATQPVGDPAGREPRG